MAPARKPMVNISTIKAMMPRAIRRCQVSIFLSLRCA
jgi:hypothetical protein